MQITTHRLMRLTIHTIFLLITLILVTRISDSGIKLVYFATEGRTRTYASEKGFSKVGSCAIDCMFPASFGIYSGLSKECVTGNLNID